MTLKSTYSEGPQPAQILLGGLFNTFWTNHNQLSTFMPAQCFASFLPSTRSPTAMLPRASVPATAPRCMNTPVHQACLVSGICGLHFLRNIVFLNSTGTRGTADRNSATEGHAQQERESASMSLGRVGPTRYVDLSRDSFPGWSWSGCTLQCSAGLICAANRLPSRAQCKTNLTVTKQEKNTLQALKL